MAKGFRRVDRDQLFLVPQDMRDWLAADHLVWFVLDAVAALDLGGFRVRYRLGGAGRAAYDPAMMLGLLIYAYAVGQRSSRQIERLCQTDVAFRIGCANDAPDHATIARFRAEHEAAIAELFEQVLVLCARAGMGRCGTVALDGTKIAADASLSANRTESTLRRMAEDIVSEAGQVDAAEDTLFGDRRGDELPAPLAERAGRPARIKKMLEDIAAERAARAARGKQDSAERTAERVRAGEEAVRRAKQRLAEQSAAWAERQAAAASAGRALPGRPPTPAEQHWLLRRAEDRLARARSVAERAGPPIEAKRNLTDPDSRIMKTRTGWVQGYNGQLLVSADYLILAAELCNDPVDVECYQPVISTGCQTIDRVNTATGAAWRIDCTLADAGYDSDANLTCAGPDRLIAQATRHQTARNAATRPATGDPPPGASPRQRMDHRLRSQHGATLYKQRGAIVEPVNGHLKDRRALRRFARRGLTAARSEFRLAATVTNLLRLRTHLATG